MNSNWQKMKMVELLGLLQRESDELHPLSTNEICRRLQEMNIRCDRRTLATDMKLLNGYGYEIMSVKAGKQNAYYLADRSFSTPELKILIDAVQAANFVTEKKTAELVEKIAALGGKHRAEILQTNLVRFNTRKHTNEAVYYNVSTLETAIAEKKQASFYYFDLNEKHKKVFRKKKERYQVHPITLIFLEDNYYLMSYSEKYEGITTYRVDRMEEVDVLDAPVAPAAQMTDEQIAAFTEQTFKMFSGEPEEVLLRFDPSLIGVVFDKFGEDIKMTRGRDGTIVAKVTVQISPTFWGWLFQFVGEMQLEGPQELKDTYKALLEEAHE